MAQAFYEKHGGKTIILARFVPIIRTFAPVVAGIGRMCYTRFLMFNVVGGVSWVSSMILAGFKSSFLPFHEKQAYLRHVGAELARYDDNGNRRPDTGPLGRATRTSASSLVS